MNLKDYDFASLVKDCKEINEKIQYKDVFECGYDKSYLSAKEIPFVGYFQGYFVQSIQKNKKIKESDKIRANCKNYLEIYKSDKELIQIVNYKNGRIDCIHQSYRDGDKIYLLPFSGKGGFYPTYTYVVVYAGSEVVEEYAVSGNQIIFDKYNRMGYLFRYNKNALFIIITHDLSILTECDNILRIEKGKIMECSKTE